MDQQLQQTRTPDGVAIAWLSVGAGPSLIHLPGVPFSHVQAEWRIPVVRRAFEGMARSVRLVQYDGRGSGLSQRDVSDLSFEAMLSDLDAVVAAARVERATLLGFYHSVPLAIAYAARHPKLVTGLVLFGGSTRGWTPMSGSGTQALLSLMERDWETFIQSATHAWLGWPDSESGRLAADWFRTATTATVARDVMRVFSGVDVSAEAAKVHCPVLVLHRRDAPVIPMSISEELVAELPTAELRIVEGESASLFFEPNQAVVQDIVEFATGGAGAHRPKGSARRPTPVSGRPGGLTPRELDVLRLLAAGETNAEIAGRLGLSVNTVERHVVNLYRKIDARGRADATAYAIRRGIA
jgi:pimeloyl-ACP methyl ester carboxylesterase/DNA-binding CsgD family transcriptional regulator